MDRDRKQDTYRDGDSDAHPEPGLVLDPEPIPNIVLHPGDTVAVYPDAIRLLDRSGRCYAVLDTEYDHHGDGSWKIDTIRFVGAFGGGVLPVRAEPEPDAQPVPVQDTTDPTTTLSADYPDAVTLYAGAIAHSHHHAHGTAAGDVLTHSHKHEHTGAESRRANELGHTADVHAHPH